MLQAFANLRGGAGLLVLVVLLLFSSQSKAYSVLRVYCQEEHTEVNVYINNNHKGQCLEEAPLDIFIEAGDITVKAVQKIEPDHERVFQEKIAVADDAAQRIWVTLSAPQLTEEAAERQRIEQLHNEKAAFESALSKAEQGDLKAMKEVAAYFREGKGAEQNEERSHYWIKKAEETQEIHSAQSTLAKARAGDIAAMRELVKRYQQGKGVEKSADEAAAWQEKADVKTAQNALRLAEQGNIKAMLQLSEYYQHGKGIEKSAAKSSEWQRKAEIEEQREKQRVLARKKLHNYDMTPMTTAIMELAEKGEGQSGLLGLTVSIPVTALYFVGIVASTADIASGPIHTTIIHQLRRKASARSSAFMAPDSMMAKAYASLDHDH